MYNIIEINSKEKNLIKKVVEIHMKSFKGFFLTFLGKGFLCQMYKSYCDDCSSGILVAFDDDNPIGFLAYSKNYSGLYKRMIKRRLIPFAWYSLGAFFRRPKVFMRLIRAFLKPGETKREEEYVELASIGVDPNVESKGIGTSLINELVNLVDFNKYKYISLETDAENNEKANCFYIKNKFYLFRSYETHEGRKMNEYRRMK